MRKTILALVAVAILLFGGWYGAGPSWTLRQMRAAAAAGDDQAFARYLDLSSLRASLKQELRRQAAGQFAGRTGDPRAGRSAALADRLIDGVVELAVTPETLRRLFAGAAAGPAVGPGPRVDLSSDELVIDREVLNTFYVRGPDQQEGGLQFTRDGLGWRLAALRLPPDRP